MNRKNIFGIEVIILIIVIIISGSVNSIQINALKDKNFDISNLENCIKKLDDRPSFIQFRNLLSFIQKTQSSDKRGFDLDEFMTNIIQNEIEQPAYEGLVYKEYYENAQYDPNIVYFIPEQVIIGFKESVDVSELEYIEDFPVIDYIEEINVGIAEIHGISVEDFIKIVEKREDVYYTEPNYLFHTCYEPTDPYWNKQWGPRAIKCPQAWDIEMGFPSIRIAIIDTGVDYQHEDIDEEYSIGWYDFVNDDSNPMDDSSISHGTHCAGTALANMNNIGIAGVAPECGIMIIKVLNSEGAGNVHIIAKGIVHAAKNDAYVMSISLGGYGSSITLRAACAYACLIQKVVIVAASGNDGVSRVMYPARYETTLAVGAINRDMNRCSWSNYGPELDLVAPGEEIYSTLRGNNYGYLSGTSTAVPYVSAVAGLFYSSQNSLGKKPIKCIIKLFSTAKDLGSKGKDLEYGYGLVDAYGSVIDIRSKNHFFNHFLK